LIYLPVDFQIHLINGWQIPIAVLATIGLFRYIIPRLSQRKALFQFLSPRVPAVVSVILLILVIPTSLYYVGSRLLEMSRHRAPYFLVHDEMAALDWLHTSTARDDIVLASLAFGQYVPGLAGNRAFLAHWANTLQFFAKRDSVSKFYSDTARDEERRALVAQFGIRYVVWGEAERRLGNWSPQTVSWLETAWSSPQVTIFRVR
jgi:hypothetical protein